MSKETFGVKVKVKAYKLSPERMEVLSDRISVLNAIGMETRCVGGRPVVSGYVCIHCNSEDPRSYCISRGVVKASSLSKGQTVEEFGKSSTGSWRMV